jgi:hypothetical protein
MALNITGSCGWGLDESFQSYFFMLHTSGVLRAYTISSTGFTLFRSVRVFNEPVVCTNNFAIKGGFGTVRAFVLFKCFHFVALSCLSLGLPLLCSGHHRSSRCAVHYCRESAARNFRHATAVLHGTIASCNRL